MSFLKKVQTNVARAKQVAMMKIGQAEGTVDAQFNQIEAEFREQYSKMKKLGKFVQNYQTAIKDLELAQQGMAQMITEQYEISDQMYTVAAQLKDSLLPQVEKLRVGMEAYYNENFHQPLAQYLQQYKLIEDRIAERNLRVIDMDRYNNELKALLARNETDPHKVQIAREKAEMKSQAYSQLNTELLIDVPRLLKDKSRFFDALFANLIQGQSQFLIDAANSLGLLEPNFIGINRTGVRAWPLVITPISVSAHQSSSTREDAMQPLAPAGGGGGQSNAPPAAPNLAKTPPPAVAVALFPFQGQDHTELTFQVNDVIVVYRQAGDWWEGELNGRRGLFPSNYVRLN